MMEDSMMTIETDDQVSQYSYQPPVIEKFTNQEKLDDLKCEVRELSREIERIGSAQTPRVSLNPDQTVVLPERSVLLKRKTQIVNALRHELETDRSRDGPLNNGQAFLSYTTQVERDVQAIEQCIANKIEEVDRINHRIRILEKSKEALKSFRERLKDSQKDGPSELELIEPLINQDFQKIKGIFNQFLKSVSPSGGLGKILQELEQASNAEGEEQYVEITDENYLWITMLEKASLVVVHSRTPASNGLELGEAHPEVYRAGVYLDPHPPTLLISLHVISDSSRL